MLCFVDANFVWILPPLRTIKNAKVYKFSFLKYIQEHIEKYKEVASKGIERKKGWNKRIIEKRT